MLPPPPTRGVEVLRWSPLRAGGCAVWRRKLMRTRLPPRPHLPLPRGSLPDDPRGFGIGRFALHNEQHLYFTKRVAVKKWRITTPFRTRWPASCPRGDKRGDNHPLRDASGSPSRRAGALRHSTMSQVSKSSGSYFLRCFTLNTPSLRSFQCRPAHRWTRP